MNALDEFVAQLERNRRGQGGVAVSVCSAHPLVLRAAFRSALRYDTFALIESTSNQVDQYGGYTGMKPADFAALVRRIAEEEGFPAERVLLGGDHLGPNSWRHLGSEKAMQETLQLVRSYVQAGYRKIHLDASFVCTDDAGPLSDEVVARRCAQMAQVAEEAASGEKPIYVVGTEVPTPGGTQADEGMHVTSPADVERTLGVFRETFLAHGLSDAWSRVVGLVIQPGVEFGDAMVHDYQPMPAITAVIDRQPGLAYEAHSTDYQSGSNLARLARNHFFILKVGPWLTYALREGLFSLECIERELNPANPSRFRETLAGVMKADPKYWEKYYSGSADEVDYKIAFSYSDRARYYLGHKDVADSLNRLLENLSPEVPDGLISQYLPLQYQAVREGRLGKHPMDLAVDRVSNVLDLYFAAGK
ncbi:MAG: class II D-tagatose-bisphosphate aldolase, non-catalytic subunit [Propionivibrio sp.]|nr:class II D-tagatose-bisphosphate aldolase, non-catalytic subunit [Propionivibrio sp.]